MARALHVTACKLSTKSIQILSYLLCSPLELSDNFRGVEHKRQRKICHLYIKATTVQL